jgi:chromosome partitioning protein
MITIAIGNHKGGVGKTTTTHALGQSLADMGHNVLMIDMDPQASLTESCGVDVGAIEGQNMADVLGGSRAGTRKLGDVIRGVGDRLALAPASIDLAITELGLAARLVGRDAVLKKELAGHLGLWNGLIEFVLIDCPPALGMLAINALTAADYIIIPTQPQVVDLRGLRLFRDTLGQLRNGDGKPKELGVLLTFWANYNLHREARAVMEGAGFRVFKTAIGRSVRVAEAPEYGKSIIDYAPDNPRSQEYGQLAREVLECLAA